MLHRIGWSAASLSRGAAAAQRRLLASSAVAAAAPRLVKIPLEPLTAEAFAPFGEICGTLAGGEPSLHVEDVISIWHTPFEADSATNILFIRYHDAPPLFSSLERHFHVTQGFLPVGGTPSIMVVAPTTPRDGADSLPEPSTVRAFLLDGTQGVILHRAVWHALSRFTLSRGAHADFYFLTDIETQLEIEAGGPAASKQKKNAYQELTDTAPPPLERTEIVDMALLEPDKAITFQVVDPSGASQ